MNASSGQRYSARIAVVVSGWPRLSETFALNELQALHQRGMLAAIYATKASKSEPQPGHCHLAHLVTVLPAGTEIAQAATLATHAGTLGVTGVHAYFAHVPATVAEHAADLLGVQFGFSTHALDARKISPELLKRRASHSAVVVACNADVAAVVAESGMTPTLLPHGVDLDRFHPGFIRAHTSPPNAPLRILSVGRFVEKKGFSVLLNALAVTTIAHTLTLIGSGTERERLEQLIDSLDLNARVQFAGSATHDQLPDAYREADVVAVPSIIDSNNDRDGLPNVVLEAMASGCALVASRVAAVPSAIDHERNGILVEPENVEALARALDQLASDPALRQRLGSAARDTACERFALECCSSDFCDALERAYGDEGASHAADHVRQAADR